MEWVADGPECPGLGQTFLTKRAVVPQIDAFSVVSCQAFPAIRAFDGNLIPRERGTEKRLN